MTAPGSRRHACSHEDRASVRRTGGPEAAGLIVLAMLAMVAACADPIGHVKPDGGSTSGEPVTTIDLPDGSKRTVIDSTDTETWRYLDFTSSPPGRETTADGTWQLRTQRFHISTHDGVEVAPVAAPFTAMTALPADGYVHDEDTDGDGAIDYAFDQGDDWYDYDATTHILTPSALTWAVRGSSGSGGFAMALEILGYYDDAGTAAVFTFHWRTL